MWTLNDTYFLEATAPKDRDVPLGHCTDENSQRAQLYIDNAFIIYLQGI